MWRHRVNQLQRRAAETVQVDEVSLVKISVVAHLLVVVLVHQPHVLLQVLPVQHPVQALLRQKMAVSQVFVRFFWMLCLCIFRLLLRTAYAGVGHLQVFLDKVLDLSLNWFTVRVVFR